MYVSAKACLQSSSETISRSHHETYFTFSRNWCNATRARRRYVKRESVSCSKACMGVEIRVFRFRGKKGTMDNKRNNDGGLWIGGDRDYSRACMPRVSRNRRKYAVNLTATTVAHHLSLERVRLSSGRRLCANRESSLVTFSRSRYTLYFHPGNLVDRHRLPMLNLSFAALNALVLRTDPKLCTIIWLGPVPRGLSSLRFPSKLVG